MGVNNGARVASARPRPGGGLLFAPLNTALPTDAATPLAAAFKVLGPVSEEGVTPSRDTTIETVREWDTSPLAQLQSSDTRTFETKLLGIHDEDVLGFLFGTGNVTVTAPTATVGTKLAVVDRGAQIARCVIVFEMMHGGILQRIVIPQADVAISGEDPYVPGSLRGFTLTLEAMKDASGAFKYEYDQLTNRTGA